MLANPCSVWGDGSEPFIHPQQITEHQVINYAAKLFIPAHKFMC